MFKNVNGRWQRAEAIITALSEMSKMEKRPKMEKRLPQQLREAQARIEELEAALKAVAKIEVLKILRANEAGVAADELVRQLRERQELSKSDIAAILRELLERGEVAVGPSLRLVIRRATNKEPAMTDIKDRLRNISSVELTREAADRIEELEGALLDAAQREGQHADEIEQAVAAERERCADKNTIIRALGNSIPVKHLDITALMIVAEDIAAAIRGEDNHA